MSFLWLFPLLEEVACVTLKVSRKKGNLVTNYEKMDGRTEKRKDGWMSFAGDIDIMVGGTA